MAVDKKKIKLDDKITSFNLKNAFNTIANLSQDLRDEAYKLDVVRAKRNINKGTPNYLLGGGIAGVGSYIAFSLMNMNPGLLHLISTGILWGLWLKIKYITSPFGNLIEKPLKFNLVELNTGKTLSNADLMALNAELPDPIKFYELGDSSFQFKISNPNLTPTKNGASEFIKKETIGAGTPEAKNIYTWDNQKSSEYALIFDEESQKTIKEIVRIYEQPTNKEKFKRFSPFLIPASLAGTGALLEPQYQKIFRPKNNQPATPVKSNAGDLTAVPKTKKRAPSREELIKRLK